MTTHYIDITLLPDAEFSHAHLIGALMTKLHRVLARLKTGSVGISFPQYCLRPRSLGSVVRLHGEAAELQRLMNQAWLQGMRDLVRLTELKLAPRDAPHCIVRRRQFKTNAERLRRRRMRRKGETEEQAAMAIPLTVERQVDLPYVRLTSASSGQAFHMFISQESAVPKTGTEGFNTYGMHLGGTVPKF